jgi:hypothetical protein
MRGLLICFLLTCTAAEVILLVVKTAAALAPVGQTSSPRSGLPDCFILQCTPAARKPFGVVIVLFLLTIVFLISADEKLRFCTSILML